MQPNLVTFENFNVNGQSRFRLERPEGTDFEAFGGHIEIDSGSSVSQSANLFRAERSASLAYTPDQQMTLPELVESVITPFNQFIEFANGRPLHLSKLTAHFPSNDRRVNNHVLPALIEVAFAGWKPPHDEGYNVPTLPLTAMKGRESELLERWMGLHGRAREAFGLIFSITSGPTLYLETQFLLAIQGLEVMHRRILPGRQLEPEELDRRIQAAQSGTDDTEIREWFRSKLRYSGEKTLRARLREILDIIGEPGRFIGRNFVSKAVTTRNFYTHYDASFGQPEQGQALVILTTQVLAVFDLFLLSQLGFENDEAGAIFSQSPRARNLAYKASVAAQQG